MRIGDVEKQNAVHRSPENRKAKPQLEAKPFSLILEGEMGAGAAENAGGNQPIEAAYMARHGLVSLGAVSGEAWNQKAYEAVEAGIQKLEGVERALGDENINPKTLDGLVHNLSTAVEEMGESVKELPEDHPLRRIADELNTLAYVESVKWRRGDYI